jgi:endonuclease/exonuclease/phosphatase family metal-dependent hydrolase
MVKKLVLVWAMCLGVALSPAASQGVLTTTVSATPAGSVLRVGSFNLRNAALPLIPGIAPWSQRRTVAIRQILDRDLDVLGIQETSYGPRAGVDYDHASTQYIDLKKGLNRAGGSYRLTSTAAYDCENPRTPYKCEPRDRGASGGDRILYNADTMELLSRGATRYAAQSGSTRQLAWAALRVRATGQEVLVTTTHLSSNATARLAQWLEMIEHIESLKDDRLVISTGDFNVRKNDEIARTTYPAMRTAGYGDVLNQEYAVNPVPDPRAQEMVNGWVGSFNGGRRNVGNYGYEDKRERTGNIIDYVFASNELAVLRWEVVVDYDPRTLQTIGTLPSDHNLVVATLDLT